MCVRTWWNISCVYIQELLVTNEVNELVSLIFSVAQQRQHEQRLFPVNVVLINNYF